MKLYREGNKVIAEFEQIDCGGQIKTPDMAADAFMMGVQVANMSRIDNKTFDFQTMIMNFDTAGKDFDERWEITPAPVDPPAGGEDAK